MKKYFTYPLKVVLYFFYSYWLTTLLGILLTVLFSVIFDLPSPQEMGVSASQAPSYLMTIPYHPLLNLAVWPLFAWLYWRGLPAGINRKSEMLNLGILWTVITIIIDLIGWVLIHHPWAMTFKEFYIDYQPWITLIYLIIFASPVMVPYLYGLIERQQKAI
jgi:putative Mn2+ efflux pump MntP